MCAICGCSDTTSVMDRHDAHHGHHHHSHDHDGHSHNHSHGVKPAAYNTLATALIDTLEKSPGTAFTLPGRDAWIACYTTIAPRIGGQTNRNDQNLKFASLRVQSHPI